MPGRRTLFLLLAGIVLLAGCGDVESLSSDKAQNFSLQSINERTVRLSDYQNKVVILKFFTTWCPSCRTQTADLIELFNEYSDKGLAIIGISIDRGGIEAVREFAGKYNVNYQVLMDDGLVSKAYGPIRSIPTTFIIDKDKNIAQKIIGARSKEYFEDAIKPLL